MTDPKRGYPPTTVEVLRTVLRHLSERHDDEDRAVPCEGCDTCLVIIPLLEDQLARIARASAPVGGPFGRVILPVPVEEDA